MGVTLNIINGVVFRPLTVIMTLFVKIGNLFEVQFTYIITCGDIEVLEMIDFVAI